MTIPIRNLYYLLCYAWDTLEFADKVDVSQDDCTSTADLFARVLEAATTNILRRGLDRQYVTEEVDTSSLRGKLDLSGTVKRNLLMSSRVHCVVDDLDHDILPNQILKATIHKLARCGNINRTLRDRLVRLYHHLGEVQRIPLSKSVFSRVVLHRNNRYYRLPLSVCRLVHERRLIDERDGQARFRDFLRDERAMARLFERFVFRFYRREQSEYRVYREQFPWQQTSGSKEDLAFLPNMATDICLESANRKIVIDTKYYRETFQARFGRETVKSGHLYQLYAYLRNLDLRSSSAATLEGILLYPTTGPEVDLRFGIHGFSVRVCTLNLDLPWRTIHEQLLGIVG